MNQQLIDDLVAAKAIMQKHGRCNGSLLSADGGVCLAGAVAAATIPGFFETAIGHAGDSDVYKALDGGANERADAVMTELKKHIPAVFHTGLPCTPLWRFNDADTDTDDIYALFDSAIASAEG